MSISAGPNSCKVGHDCDPNADCINTDDGYRCQCKTQFFGDSFTCGGIIKLILKNIQKFSKQGF